METAFHLLGCCVREEPLPRRLAVPLCEVALALLPGSTAALMSDERTPKRGPIQLLMDTPPLLCRFALVAGSAAPAEQWSRALQQLRRAIDLALPLLGDGGWPPW